jgi:hypothetical protein
MIIMSSSIYSKKNWTILKGEIVMAGLNMQMEWKTRLCQVGEKFGYSHAWEHYSKPLEASPLMGGAPAGIFSKMFGIVEFSDGVRRVDPSEIVFCDEENETLSEMEKMRKEKEYNDQN